MKKTTLELVAPSPSLLASPNRQWNIKNCAWDVGMWTNSKTLGHGSGTMQWKEMENLDERHGKWTHRLAHDHHGLRGEDFGQRW